MEGWRDSLLRAKVAEGCCVVSFSPVLSVEKSTDSWETIECYLTQITLFSFISQTSHLLWGSGSWRQKAGVRQVGEGQGWGSWLPFSSRALTPLCGPLAHWPGVADQLDGGQAPELLVTLSCESSRVGILKVFAVSTCRTSSTLPGDLMSKRSRSEMWK